MLTENGKEMQGPELKYDKMTQKEYKKMLQERDEKELKEALKQKREQELFERRRAKQVERAAKLAKLQQELGSTKIELHGSIEEVYQINPEVQKITTTYRPSKLPTRNVKTADPREKKRREEEKRKMMAEKVVKYDSIRFYPHAT